uniref:FLYWCH-type domain-containing protein n=1 Tax=Bombyx mori TaxID=7091 RepID=A0A8R2HT21_BOMMO|nr:uncharacterized protein LOC101735705 isoform X2 [Bombyx mori]
MCDFTIHILQGMTISTKYLFVEFVISNRGRRHMRLGGFSFYAEKVFPEKSKVRWRCTRRTCRAYAHTLHDKIFALNEFVRLSVGPGGRPRLWVRGRSFYAAHTMRSGVVRWRCTMGGCGCKAYTQKGTLHKLVGEHNHVNRGGRRAAKQSNPMINARASSPPTPLLLSRIRHLDIDNFDPNAWMVRN